MENYLFWIAPAASFLALALAAFFYKQMKGESEGTPEMQKIAEHIRRGAMSYLKQQYKVVTLVFIGLALLFAIMAYGFNLQNHWVPIAFLTGGFFSGLSGYLGMKTATYASARTANAARHSLDKGLRIAFRSGAVMGLVVVGLGLFDISFWYLLLQWCIPDDMLNPTSKLCVITTTMLTFGMGASTQALFARVGGGIYTKAADVGADLVGKVEAGIPEDDPRNPATIADNVGDNVGDVAGPLRILLRFDTGDRRTGRRRLHRKRGHRNAIQGSYRPDADSRHRNHPLHHWHLLRAHPRERHNERASESPLYRYQPQFVPDYHRHLPHPLAAWTGQLGEHLIGSSRRTFGGCHHRTIYRILHFPIV